MGKLLLYELKNISRSRWIVALFLFVLALCCGVLQVSGTPKKALLTTMSILFVGNALFSGLFSVVYWYYSDRYTQLVLTMPVYRGALLNARFLALSLSLGIAVIGGVILPFLAYGAASVGLLLGAGLVFFTTLVSVALGLAIGICCADRLKGIGIMLLWWLYVVLLHDALLLAALAALREYPVDTASVLFAALNPLGIVRIVFLLFNDAPLLLSQTGAVVRNALTSHGAYLVATIIVLLWIAGPLIVARRCFLRKDL